MKNLSVFILFIIASSLFYAGCEYDTPQQIYPRESAPDPIITSMVPESAENGVLEIKILGTNFSTDPNQNFVYFGTIEGHVINATENEVTVLRPVSIRGEHLIKLSVRESFSIAEFGPYSLEPGIMAISQPGEINSFAVDNDENVYYEYDEVVYKVSPSGEITEFGTFDARSSAMRVGPGGDLYIQRDDNRDIYKIPSSGGNAEKFLRVRRNVSYFDFDSKGNIYSGGEKYGICFTTPDNNSVETGLYQRTFYIKAVRIFEDYVYVAADTLEDEGAQLKSGIWKHKINEDGSLQDGILVYDWDESPYGNVAQIYDITFSADGHLFIASDNQNPLIILDATGNTEILYSNSFVDPVDKICWGTGKYMYVNIMSDDEEKSGVFRVVMGKEGAPYYGRQ